MSAIVVTELKHLVTQLTTMGFMIMMIAYKLHVLSCFVQNRIIYNEHFLIERYPVTLNKNAIGRQVNELSPIETGVIEKPVIGILSRH